MKSAGESTLPCLPPFVTLKEWDICEFHLAESFWSVYQLLKRRTTHAGKPLSKSRLNSRSWLTKSNALLASRKQAKTGVFLCRYLAVTFLMVPVQSDVDIPLLNQTAGLKCISIGETAGVGTIQINH